MFSEKTISPESTRLVKFRDSKATPKQKQMMYKLVEALQSKGYIVETLNPVWHIVRNPAINADIEIQLEVDPNGSNLDMVLIDPKNTSLTFPLAGGWVLKSWVKIYKDNLDFAVARIEAFFDIHEKDDTVNIKLGHDVKQELNNRK